MWKLEEAIFKIGPKKKKKDRDVKQGSPAAQDFSLPKLGPPALPGVFDTHPLFTVPCFWVPRAKSSALFLLTEDLFFSSRSVVGSWVWIPKLPAITRVPPGAFKVRSPQLARKLGFLCAALSCRGSTPGETGENPDYYTQA